MMASVFSSDNWNCPSSQGDVQDFLIMGLVGIISVVHISMCIIEIIDFVTSHVRLEKIDMCLTESPASWISFLEKHKGERLFLKVKDLLPVGLLGAYEMGLLITLKTAFPEEGVVC
jgi:hypothetical protein